MPFLTSLFFGFVPMFFFAYILYWTDRYEREPKILLVAVFFWGVAIAAGGAFIINTVLGMGVYIFTGSETASDLTTGSIIAPIVEEALKGLAVLIVFLVFRKEFDSILDGIVYAGIAALGFAATENTHYIYNLGYLESGWEGLWFLVFVRVILVGWQHPFYTAFTGIGLAITRLQRSGCIRYLAPLIGISIAMFTHAFHNTMASFLTGTSGLAIGTFMDWTGWFFMFLFILWAVASERKLLMIHLKEEVSLGLITATQYHTATSTWKQTSARFQAFFNGRYPATQRFYQICGELAHKKHQYHTLGNEKENVEIIKKYRAELKTLREKAEA
ncbi:MAG: PrsW family intramembrane metalloprotease [Anaerolineales bacterium]|uniref:PrsW family intramembrane metalloprotease n=1 Tax=Candidatus Desulfolinea nitratireducens TaxID=2841698 RepID=A0A8J6TE22_9CHLR|nr:PrsW family intramembrane metalloprotease [Candidatus Desulfolinea nitratireducens]MBL6960206.1 PrsW family intramembrane metalloprotease [Anaerolineales bacterium]